MIKQFRIWSKELKIFTNWAETSKDSFEEIVIHPNGSLIAGKTLLDGNQYIVQQYTGLQDSKNREIYEGDIVTFRPKSNKPPFWEVKFDYGLAMYCLFNRRKETYFEYEDFIRGHICGPDIRIIGNIFQTPELLEKC